MANEHIFRTTEVAQKSEVVLTAEEASEAARLIKLLFEKGAEPDAALEREVRSLDALLSSPARPADRTRLVRLARRTFFARRARDHFVGGAMFGEPAWDMLLALYFTEGTDRQTISSLSVHSAVPATTALRWIDHLVAKRLIHRTPHMTDRRITYLEISDKGREGLDAYFSAVLEKGFADQ